MRSPERPSPYEVYGFNRPIPVLAPGSRIPDRLPKFGQLASRKINFESSTGEVTLDVGESDVNFNPHYLDNDARQYPTAPTVILKLDDVLRDNLDVNGITLHIGGRTFTTHVDIREDGFDLVTLDWEQEGIGVVVFSPRMPWAEATISIPRHLGGRHGIGSPAERRRRQGIGTLRTLRNLIDDARPPEDEDFVTKMVNLYKKERKRHFGESPEDK